MDTDRPDPDAVRHRLLEGVLLRLAARPDGGELVVRGGMLLRHWFRPDPRPAEDLDLVAAFPFDAAEVRRRLEPVLADRSVADGVAFDQDGVRLEGMWLETGSPGVRVFASGTADRLDVDFHIDVTFGPPPRPDPEPLDLPTGCGLTARVLACRPEAVVGHKVQALWHRGLLGWRPKDLDDLRLLLARVPVDGPALRAAVAAYLADAGGTPEAVAELFGTGSWWVTKMAGARWRDFAAASPARSVPRDLAAVAAGVGARLRAAMGGGA